MISIILGTRPEIIKMSPIIRECENRFIEYFIIHTGQHYSYNMDKIFFEQLNLPEPKFSLEVGSGLHGEQTGKMLTGIEEILMRERPDIILVEGDTNTVLAGAIAASKLHIKIGHVEAGLRSYDRDMPEEINRILTDHCSDYLFSPTEKAKEILIKEGINENQIFVTGNTIVDAVYQNIKLLKNDILEKLNLNNKDYILMTAHRQENVDNLKRFKGIIKGIELISKEFDIPIIYPIHPRSMKMIKEFCLHTNRIILTEPLDYFNFLNLESNARIILTDSGGIQEEACILNIPCVTLRDNTERLETIEVGANKLAGTYPKKILEITKEMMSKGNKWKNPFGDGNAGKKIIDKIVDMNLTN